jgi:hypothetical protein
VFQSTVEKLSLFQFDVTSSISNSVTSSLNSAVTKNGVFFVGLVSAVESVTVG